MVALALIPTMELQGIEPCREGPKAHPAAPAMASVGKEMAPGRAFVPLGRERGRFGFIRSPPAPSGLQRSTYAFNIRNPRWSGERVAPGWRNARRRAFPACLCELDGWP